MAGEFHEVDLGDELTLTPWPVVLELADALRPSEWVLVGGLMVRLHERRARIAPVRVTVDVDVLVDVAAPGVSMARIAAALADLGFEPRVPIERARPLHRFARGGDQIDVMVPDHLPPRARTRLRNRPLFAVDGGAQALARRDSFHIAMPGASVEIAAPDLLGALVAKAVAHRVDSRDRERHLSDAAVLLACMIDGLPTGLHGTLSKNDRRRLRHLVAALEPTSEAWDQLAPADADRGRRMIRLIGALTA